MTPRTRVLLIGAGGHARVCVEALTDDPAIEVIGAVSRDGLAVDGLGIPMLGVDSDLAAIIQQYAPDGAHLAIGDNAVRAAIGASWQSTGGRLIGCISRFAMLSRSVHLDDGVAVLPGAVVNAASSIGCGAILNTNASVDHDCVIGAYTHVAPGATIGGGVTVGAQVLVGLGARVLPGVTIGDGAVIGAGAVVVGDIAASATVVGVPARPRSG